jgi:hypothetical protein
VESTHVDSRASLAEERGRPSRRSPTRRTIGRYRLTHEIATGGQATVYLGVAEGPAGFEKVVAVKVLHPHLASDATTVSQFLDEARLAARLTHPHVCGVIDFGIDDGDHFLAMEYIPGVTVAAVLARAAELAHEGRLDKERWGALVGLVCAGVAEGLHAVHGLRDPSGRSLHVVHRDVSPKNVLIGFDGSVRLVDFGIAKHDAREAVTEVGEVKGTAAYMSPEQARGEPIDARADVWALGVLAWELLALRRLFYRGGGASTMLAVLGDPIAPPSSIDPAWSEQVDAALGWALVRDPAARTDDARVVASMLVEGVGVSSAGELAAWIGVAFPHAEVEARSLVDLARQSAGELPAADAALDQRRRHLAAIALLQSARSTMLELERAVAAGRDDAEVDRWLTECRLTLLQASREWPEDPEIRESLESILRLAVRHELRREDVGGARALLGQMRRRDDTLVAEVDVVAARVAERKEAAARLEALARDQDPRVTTRSRAASMAALIATALVVVILALTHHPGEVTHEVLLRISVVQSLAGFAVLALVARSLLRSTVGRRFGALVVALAVTGFAHRVVGAWQGIDPAAVLAMDLVRHALATAAAGLILARTAWAVVIPLAALGLTVAFPAETPLIVSLSAVLNLGAVAALSLYRLEPPRPLAERHQREAGPRS